MLIKFGGQTRSSNIMNQNIIKTLIKILDNPNIEVDDNIMYVLESTIIACP
jgi:hypothetical protein